MLRTIGDSRNVELGGDKFGLEECKGLRNNELRAPKARSHPTRGSEGSSQAPPEGPGAEPQPPTQFRAF